MEIEELHKVILLFDGYCNLCNGCVKFVLKHEKNSLVKFASLQSETGEKLLNKYHINPKTTDSLVLIENGKAYIKSTAALKLSKYMKGIYPFCMVFIIVPPIIRNWVYDFIAKHRYKWFGKSDTCMVPDKNLANRFL